MTAVKECDGLATNDPCSLITSSTNGFDGSMMNGLQALPQWRSAFNNPSGGQLGLLNAIQNIGSLAGYDGFEDVV